MLSDPIIRLDRVSKHYTEGAETRHVLEDASVSFAEGEVVAVHGRSGSGKSTLLNLVAGIDSPTGGEVWVAGTCLSRLSSAERTLFRRDHLGFVFQFFNLIPTLRVLENVQLPADLRGLSPEDAAERARVCLGDVGLSDREESFPDRLSGGEQQRVAIARALVQAPRILLADEPTGNLDTKTGEMIIETLSAMSKQRGVTIISATHDHKMLSVSDRVVTIRDGRIDKIEHRSQLNIEVGTIHTHGEQDAGA